MGFFFRFIVLRLGSIYGCVYSRFDGLLRGGFFWGVWVEFVCIGRVCIYEVF